MPRHTKPNGVYVGNSGARYRIANDGSWIDVGIPVSILGGDAKKHVVRDENGSTYVAKKYLGGRFYGKDRLKYGIERDTLSRIGQHNGGEGLHGVVRLHDYNDNDFFLILEFVQGGSLDDIRRLRHRFQPIEMALVVAYVAQTLDSMLTQFGITHGDVKPQNIIASQKATMQLASSYTGSQLTLEEVVMPGFLRLIDLAGARINGNSRLHEWLAKKDMFYGTILYSPPEALLLKANERSDVFSLGMVAYEMLQGELPFSEGNPESLMLARVKEDVPRLGFWTIRKLKGLEELVHAMVNRDPEKRPPFSEVYARMSEFLWQERRLDFEALMGQEAKIAPQLKAH